jgi:di/tricarboxylate transporter
VLGPGGYRFSDFLKVGLPLQLASLAAALLAIPLLRPF